MRHRSIPFTAACAFTAAAAVFALAWPAEAGSATATRRSSAGTVSAGTHHSGGHRHHSGRFSVGVHFGHFGHYGHFGYRHYYPYWYGYSPYWYGYGAYSRPGPYYGPRGYYGAHDRREPHGALDLNVRPRSTEVYIDGEYVGLARNFDGYPGFLWLDEGTYELSFYRDGYETVTRRLTVQPDAVLEVRERLKKGAAVRPEPKPEPPESEAAGEGAAPAERPDAVVTYPRRTEAGEE